MKNPQPSPNVEAVHSAPDFLNRTIALLGTEAVHALGSRTVAVAGCGGVGGGVAMTMARMGVGSFILADPGVFDPPDTNRQWGSTIDTMGQNKCDAYETTLLSINPEIRISSFTDGICDDNIDEFLAGADILIDCLDVSVPTDTRMRLFRRAREHGIYSISAPILGFGTVMIAGAPDGMPMEAVFGQMVSDAASKSRLPPGLWSVFVPEHLAASEALLEQHRVPSVATSVVAATSLVCTESMLILLGASFSGWRPPVCLPHVTVFEPLRSAYRTMHIRDLAASAEPGPTESMGVGGNRSPGTDRQARRGWNETCGFNVALLPQDAIPIDLMTDSWSEIDRPPRVPVPDGDAIARPEDLLQGLYGYRYAIPVFRGRFAEALLAQSMVRRGGIVVTNGLFPSTLFHIQNAGGVIREAPIAEAYDVRGDGAFKADVDLAALHSIMADGDVAMVYVELCNNALGGHPVSLANLRALREVTAERGIPLVLDTTRAFENAWLLRARDPACRDRSLVSLVHEMCALSDACAASLTKDFSARAGAFVAVNDEQAFIRLRDLALLAYGTGLSADASSRLAAALGQSPDGDSGAAARAEQVADLWQRMRDAGVPVLAPCGGHAVYVDVAELLPHLAKCAHAPEALAAALFELGGVRAIRNMSTAGQIERGLSLMRLALPVNCYGGADLGRIVSAFEKILEDPEVVRPLERLGNPKGKLGVYTAQYSEQ